MGLIVGSGRFPGGGNGNPHSILVWKIPGQKSLVGYSSWGHKESDTTKQLSPHTHTYDLEIEKKKILIQDTKLTNNKEKQSNKFGFIKTKNLNKRTKVIL